MTDMIDADMIADLRRRIRCLDSATVSKLTVDADLLSELLDAYEDRNTLRKFIRWADPLHIICKEGLRTIRPEGREALRRALGEPPSRTITKRVEL